MADAGPARPFPSRRLATGRLAGVACLTGGLIGIVFRLTPFYPGGAQTPWLVTGGIAVLVGIGALFAPWDRWPWWASLVLVAAMTVNVGTSGFVGTTRYVAPFYVMIFAWLGVGYGRWFSLGFSPFALAAGIVPILLAPGAPAGDDLATVAIAVACGVTVGESMALVGTKLRGFQRALIESERRASEAFEQEKEVSRRLTALDDMKNTFLQAVSHELRTPLTAILGGALTLQQAMGMLSEDEARDLAGRTAANARKLQRLLSDLLDLDRLQRGIVLAQPRPIDVGALARRVVEESDAFSARRIRLEAEPVVADVDGPKVERIVENLMTNALKHTPPETAVRMRVLARDGGILVAVEDDGPGIPDPMKEAVFEPFRRGQNEQTPGTGIGLALVARFAELHGGRAWVQDRPGGGASFRVWLPATQVGVPTPEVEASAASPEVEASAPGARRALRTTLNRARPLTASLLSAGSRGGHRALPSSGGGSTCHS